MEGNKYLPNECPNCGSNLVGEEIPQEYREHVGGATNYHRGISIYSMEKDCTTAFRCPDCGHEWPVA